MSNDSVETPIARQQLPNTHQWTNWEALFSARPLRQLLDSKIEELLEAVFSVRSVPGCFTQDKPRI
jgi:hypothetical protein